MRRGGLWRKPYNEIGYKRKMNNTTSQDEKAASNATEQSRKTDEYMSLPYNHELSDLAKKLRKSGNLSEVLLWQQLRKNQFSSLDFDRQKIIGNYIVDFYCSNCKIVIEIDGESHIEKAEYDRARDKFLEKLGLKVIHILDKDVKKNLTEVMEMLKDTLIK